MLGGLLAIALSETAGARAIRSDLFTSNGWYCQTSGSEADPASCAAVGPTTAFYLPGMSFSPAGVTGSTPLYEFYSSDQPDSNSNPTNIYTDNTSGTPNVPGNPITFNNAYMLNYGATGTQGTSPQTAQVMVYQTTDLGQAGNVLCDDVSSKCITLSGGLFSLTEIQFNYPENVSGNTCAVGGMLTFNGASYANTSVGGGTCDNTFVFENGKLFGDVPDGWTPVPLPGSMLLLGSAILGGLLLRPVLRRRGEVMSTLAGPLPT